MTDSTTTVPPLAVDQSRLAPPAPLPNAYSLTLRVTAAGLAVAVGVLAAGFWNFQLVDGFGRDVVAARTIGDTGGLGGSFVQNGFGFGFLFAAIAGLAATFTACNCVVFAMLPGLAAGSAARSRRPALVSLGVFSAAVMIVGAGYGAFVGLLGPEGVAAFNSRPVRFAQAGVIFSSIGVFMLVWGALEFGFLDRVGERCSPETRAFFAQPTVKAGILGTLVGAFAIGRPFPVMREFLVYAATAESPLYGAAVMVVQGLGQIAVMVLLLLFLIYGLGSQLTRWVASRPQQVAMVTAVALVAGGTFFVYYWGLARAFDIGRWGFRLGWY